MQSGENYSLSGHLQELLSEAEMVELAEKHGGLSLYIAQTDDKMSHDLPAALKQKLVAEFGGIYITIPLAREFRAHYYQKQGFNKRYIAKKLGLTESAVRKLFARKTPPRSLEKAAGGQLDMIDYLAQRRL